MDQFELMQTLNQTNDKRIVLLVLDGLGGLPKDGKTELEAARTPNLDRLVSRSETGLMVPIIRGITPGSGPGHLALFGYDPLTYIIGRGILSALGVNFPIQKGDLAARVNFATIDEQGNVTDRRAGRIPDEINKKMCEKIRKITLPGVSFFIETEKDHRAALIFRGQAFSDTLSETDPQQTGVPPHKVKPLDQSPEAQKTADLINRFNTEVREKLKDEHPANGILLRGFALYKHVPCFKDIYGLNACAIAGYPMYRGLARLVGMEVIDDVSSGVVPQFKKLQELWGKYDFYFVHIKYTDSFGEDGKFDKKVQIIEEVDRNIGMILDLNPDVFAMTADHSTPAVYMAHSWHPVPLLIRSKWCRQVKVSGFNEAALTGGTLSTIHSLNLMPLLLAHAEKLAKFGA
jgi:2,3-bisphosphoglycerate-independent phosphoglycerate mutase